MAPLVPAEPLFLLCPFRCGRLSRRAEASALLICICPHPFPEPTRGHQPTVPTLSVPIASSLYEGFPSCVCGFLVSDSKLIQGDVHAENATSRTWSSPPALTSGSSSRRSAPARPGGGRTPPSPAIRAHHAGASSFHSGHSEGRGT